ncbi:transposase family protein [Geodermatophilus marinus]|nr:transposase family protein [Geodermatophilus sp. LHW52908]
MASSPARAVSDQAPARAPVTLPAELPAHLAASLVTELGAGDAASMSSLATALAAVPDARHRRGRRHELIGMLAIAACACLTGASSYVAIGEWAAAQGGGRRLGRRPVDRPAGAGRLRDRRSGAGRPRPAGDRYRRQDAARIGAPRHARAACRRGPGWRAHPSGRRLRPRQRGHPRPGRLLSRGRQGR